MEEREMLADSVTRSYGSWLFDRKKYDTNEFPTDDEAIEYQRELEEERKKEELIVC